MPVELKEFLRQMKTNKQTNKLFNTTKNKIIWWKNDLRRHMPLAERDFLHSRTAYLWVISSCAVIFLPPGDVPSPSPSEFSCCSNVGNLRSRSSVPPSPSSLSSPSSSLPANDIRFEMTSQWHQRIKWTINAVVKCRPLNIRKFNFLTCKGL